MGRLQQARPPHGDAHLRRPGQGGDRGGERSEENPRREEEPRRDEKAGFDINITIICLY